MMKIKSKVVLTIILSIIVGMIPVCPCNAEAEAIPKEVSLLIDLGIIDSDSDTYSGEQLIPRKEFIYWIGNILGCNSMELNRSSFVDIDPADYYAAGAETALQYGLISGYGDGKFYPDNKITYIETVKICMSLLGYDQAADMYGGYPNGYLRAANESGVTEKTIKSNDSKLTYNEAARLIYNTLDTRMIGAKEQTANGVVSRLTDTNILQYYLHTYKDSGIITENSRTTFTVPKNEKKGTVKINGVKYHTDIPEIEDMIGRYVDFYYSDEDGEYTIRSVRENQHQTTVLTVRASEIIGYNDSLTAMTYEKNENNRKTIKISETADLIYNGKAYPNYSTVDLTPMAGTVTFIDNNADKIYELIIVKAYQTIFVKGAGKTHIYSQYQTEPNLAAVDIEKAEELLIFGEDNEEGDITDIKENTVVWVEQDKNGEYIKLYLSAKQIIGQITHEDEEKITLGENEYELSDAYIVAKNANETGSFNVGDTCTVYFDGDDRVAGVKKFSGTERQYGYLRKIKINDEDDSVSLRIFGSDGKWVTYPTPEKIKIDDAGRIKTINIGNALSADTMIRFKLNKNGEVEQIETPKSVALSDKAAINSYIKDGIFFKIPEISLQFQGNNRQFGEKILKGDNVLVFALPDKGNEADEDLYSIQSPNSFLSEANYVLEYYDLDDFYEASVIVRRGIDKTSYEEGHIFIVTSKGVKSSDDDVVSWVRGMYRGAEWSFNGKNAETFKDVQPGDIIQMDYNQMGRTDGYDRCYSYKKQGLTPGESYSNQARGILSATTILRGKVTNIDMNRSLVQIDTGENLRLTDTSSLYNTYIYHTGSKEVEVASPMDIKYNDFLVIRWWALIARQIVIIRD